MRGGGSGTKTIRLLSKAPDGSCDALEGHFIDERWIDHLLTCDADVYKPNGDILLKFRKGAIPARLIRSSFAVFKEAAVQTNQRGSAAGKRPGGPTGQKRFTKSGYESNFNEATGAPVQSGIIGFMDRKAHFPYCRLTAYNLHHGDRFASVVPFIRSVDAVFKANAPERHAAQMAIVRQTSPDFYIHGTAFTTVTVNRNFRTAVHKDRGDLKAGLGVMACLRGGVYSGCYLCWPEYRVAVDLHSGDVVLGDVHEWHGNTPLLGKTGKFERISLVFYYREHMRQCGSAADELERAKEVRGAV